MKMIIRLSLIALVIFIGACKKEDPPPPENNSTTNNTTTSPPSSPYADYWGCWREATGKNGVYDIILTEDTVGPHIFELGTSCVKESNIPSQDIGIFRNDTLILDNGMYEFWCFIENDTMLYSAYVPNATTEKFIKI